MNELFNLLDIASWKPVVTALLLPPVPFIVLALIGARLILPRRGLGWILVLFSLAGLWLANCSGTAVWLQRMLVKPPPALTAERLRELRAGRPPATAIVVLGGGVEPSAPEYQVATLVDDSLERLRYGLWLARASGWPVAFSGGVGYAQRESMPEARVAERIAADEFGRPLRWVEDRSRDTRENARLTLALLRPAGIGRIVLVTHASHMPRALRAFQNAAAGSIEIVPAPMGFVWSGDRPALRWMPSSRGNHQVRAALREWLGQLADAA